MCSVKSLRFLVAIVLLSLVQSKEICDFEDAKCMTHGARNSYKILVAGLNDLLEPIDPIFIQDIKGETQGAKYSLKNPKMTGLRNCNVTNLVYQPDRVTYEYKLFCPQLVIQYAYEAKGDFGPLKLDGNGNEKITLDDYEIILKGHSQHFVSEVDNKPRLRVIDFNLETEPKGKITFDVNDLVRGNKEKSAEALAYLNENALAMEKYLRPTIIQKFMEVFIDRANILLTTIPLDDLIPKIYNVTE